MLKKYELFIFDWDGTLMNTTQTIIEATKYACQLCDLPEVSSVAARSIIGKSYEFAILELIPELALDSRLKEKFIKINEEYLNRHTLSNPFFHYAIELLEYLNNKNKLLAVATGRSRAMLDDILDNTNTRDYFVITKTATECFSKPHPQMILEILDYTGVDKLKAVMIGDTIHDIEMAGEAKIDSIALSHGAESHANLASVKPDYLLNNLKELYALIYEEN